MTVNPSPLPESPKWSSTTKTVVGIAIVILIAGLMVLFRNIIGPLLLAFILAFLLHPVSAWVSKKLKVSWRISVNLVYLVLVLILAASFTLSGLALIQQAQSLIVSIDNFIQSLPELVEDLSNLNLAVGPFYLDFSTVDLESLTNQILDIVRPVIGQAGTLLAKGAASAATTFAWGLFVILISYFLLSEGGHLRENLVHLEIPGYNADIRILAQKLGTTWDAFLRGQLLISLLVVVSYYLMLTILGTRLTLVIALMAGLARFVPYLGPAITWAVTVIVVFFQDSNYFGLEPMTFTILVVSCCIILDQVFDNMVVPRILGQRLGLHPAGVLVAALVAARLIGLIGVVLAAPVLATLLLVGRYVSRKMFDLPPWPAPTEERERPPQLPWVWLRQSSKKLWSSLLHRKQ